MNNHPDSTTEEVKAPVVTFSNIPLDDDPPVPAFDSIPEPEDVTLEMPPQRAAKFYAAQMPSLRLRFFAS